MAKKWSDVTRSPNYQMLSDSDKEAARNQYFESVIAPQIQTPDEVAKAKSQFDSQYGIKAAKKADFSDVTGGFKTSVAKRNSEQGLFDRIGDAILPSAKQRAEIRAVDPVTNAIMEIGDPMQHHALNLPYGLAQSLGHGLEYGSEKLLGRDNGLTTSLRNDNIRADAENKKRELDYQTRNPDTVATYAGATAGAVGPWMYGAPAKATSWLASKLAPVGSGVFRRAGAGAVQGGVMASATPVTGEGDYASQKATQMAFGVGAGGLIPVTAAGIGGIYSGGKELFNMVARPDVIAQKNLARLYGSDQATVDKLRSAPQYFPDEQITAAQALQTPEAVMVEKAMRNRPEMRMAFENMDSANNAGRVGILQKIAGTDEQLTGLLGKRKKDSEPFLRQLEDESNKASNSAIVKKLDELAKRGNATVSGAAKAHLAKIRENSDNNGDVSARVLDDIRQDINGMLARHAPQNSVVNSQESALYAPVSSKIIKAIDDRIPGYRDYLSAYRSNSQPINTIEAGKRILGPLNSRRLNSSGDQNLTINDVAQGFKRDDKARYGMSPEARADLSAVQNSLQRRSISDGLRSPGSDTAYNLQADSWIGRNLLGPSLNGPTKTGYGLTALLGAAAGNTFAPGLLGSGGGALVAGGLKKAAEAINSRVASSTSVGVMDSRKAATMIEEFLKKNPQNRRQLLEAYPQWVQIIGGTSQKAITQE